jgi:hypothetical protein
MPPQNQVSQVERKVEIWERHGQTILLAVTTTALLGTASILYNSNAVQASMAADIRTLTGAVSELKGTIGAMQLNYVTRVEFNVHEQRIQRVESTNHTHGK